MSLLPHSEVVFPVEGLLELFTGATSATFQILMICLMQQGAFWQGQCFLWVLS